MEKTVEILKNGYNIAILPHNKADGDTLGSSFALCEALNNMGKNAKIITDFEITPKYMFLTEGRDYLTQETKGYDTVVTVDVADSSLLGSRKDAFKKIDLCIDHHRSNPFYAGHTLLDPSASAAGEIIYEILVNMGIAVVGNLARDIYTAIATDTGCFRFSNTTAKTFQIASEIVDKFVGIDDLNRLLFDVKSRQRLELETKVARTLEFYDHGRIAVIHMTTEMMKGANEDDIDGLSQYPRRIEGVEIGITMRQADENMWRVSMRSNGVVDVSEICQIFDGGGHLRAAGCNVEGSLTQAKKELLDAVHTKYKEM